MSGPPREYSTALGATQVDQRAGERPRESVDQGPAPPPREASRSGWWYVAAGVVLVLVALVLLFLL